MYIACEAHKEHQEAMEKLLENESIAVWCKHDTGIDQEHPHYHAMMSLKGNQTLKSLSEKYGLYFIQIQDPVAYTKYLTHTDEKSVEAKKQVYDIEDLHFSSANMKTKLLAKKGEKETDYENQLEEAIDIFYEILEDVESTMTWNNIVKTFRQKGKISVLLKCMPVFKVLYEEAKTRERMETFYNETLGYLK